MTRSLVTITLAIRRPRHVRDVVHECRRQLGTEDAVPLLTRKRDPAADRAAILNDLAWDVPAALWLEYSIDGPRRNQIASDTATGKPSPRTRGLVQPVRNVTIMGEGKNRHDRHTGHHHRHR